MADNRSHLRELAALYFHQDFDREYADADSALEDFASGYDAEYVAVTVAELKDAMSENTTEAQLMALWIDHLNAYFEPDTVGLTYRGWFEHMLDVLRANSQR